VFPNVNPLLLNIRWDAEFAGRFEQAKNRQNQEAGPEDDCQRGQQVPTQLLPNL
jgi:hypothetical protein